MNSSIVRFALAFVTFVLAGCSVHTNDNGPLSANAVAAAQVNAGGYGVAAPQGMGPTFGPQMQVAAPPKNLALLGTPFLGCERGPLTVELKNQSNDYVALQIDGLDVTMATEQGPLPPYIPPHTSFYICLDRLGAHTITGSHYTFHYGQPVRGYDFMWQGDFWPLVNEYVGHRTVQIEAIVIRVV